MFAQRGRGGTGRRAGLRSLLPQGSGSSILLVRTILMKEKGRLSEEDSLLLYYAESLITLSRCQVNFLAPLGATYW